MTVAIFSLFKTKTMQIFYLDVDPVKAAKMMCDEHMRKSIIELLQILSTVWAIHCPLTYNRLFASGKLYKPWRVYQHPSIQWVMQSRGNYNYTVALLVACLDEYHVSRVESGKGDRVHACDHMAEALVDLGHPSLPDIDVPMSQEYQAIPVEYKEEQGDVAYRRLYNEFKVYNMKMSWRNGRTKPEWFQH